MNQSKFSLGDVLTLLVALAFGFVCFLGENFLSLGDTSGSITFSVIISLLLGGIAFEAKLLKRTKKNFKTCVVFERILLVLFTLLLISFTCSSFSHYFVVTGQKAEIQYKLTANIEQAENMFEEYERYADNRENLYRHRLRSVVDAKDINPREYYDEYGFQDNDVPAGKQIENKMFTVHADLFPTNYEEMKKVGTSWLRDTRYTLNNWWAWNLGIVEVVKNMETNSNDWLNTLKALSSIREKGEQADNFAYNLSFDDVKNHFTTLGNPDLPSVGLALLAYLLMLLSWFVTKRDTRSTGALTTAPYEVEL